MLYICRVTYISIGNVFDQFVGGLQRWGGVGSSSSASSLELQTRPKAPPLQGLPYFDEGLIEREEAPQNLTN